jgi:hypothetical protein
MAIISADRAVLTEDVGDVRGAVLMETRYPVIQHLVAVARNLAFL